MTGKVLIADGLATHRISLAAALDRAFYDVIVTGSGAEALRALRRERPDIVIASTALPDMEPARFCTSARALSGGGEMPVILLGGALSRPERLALLAAGADDVLSAPVDRSLLLAGLRNRLRARAADAELTLRDDTRLALGLAEAAGTAFQPPARVALIKMSAADDMSPALERLRSLVPDRIEPLPAAEALRASASASPTEAFIIVETGDQPRGRAGHPEHRARPVRHRRDARGRRAARAGRPGTLCRQGCGPRQGHGVARPEWRRIPGGRGGEVSPVAPQGLCLPIHLPILSILSSSRRA